MQDSGLLAYSLALLNNVAFNVVEFAKSQIDWMSEKLMNMFREKRSNPFQFRLVRIKSVVERHFGTFLRFHKFQRLSKGPLNHQKVETFSTIPWAPLRSAKRILEVETCNAHTFSKAPLHQDRSAVGRQQKKISRIWVWCWSSCDLHLNQILTTLKANQTFLLASICANVCHENEILSQALEAVPQHGRGEQGASSQGEELTNCCPIRPHNLLPLI